MRFFALAALLTLVGAVAAAPPVAPPPRAAKPKFAAPKFNDAYEVIIFANARPVRVRVAVFQEGQSLGVMWRDRLQKAFAYFDRDGDGALDDKEAGYAFTDAGLVQLLQNGLYQPTGTNAPTAATFDRDGDGRVSLEEFVAHYRLAAAQLIRALPVQPDNAQNAGVTEALFALMDANGDGKLTRDEVRAVEGLLATRDADEDECLSMAELAPNLFARDLGGRRFAVPFNPPNGTYPPPAAAQAVVVYEPGRVPGTVTQQVIKKYDRDGDFELTRVECGFDDGTFTRLDADGNGRLDGEELDVWRTGAPDLELTLSLAPKPADCVAKLVGDAAARGFKLKQVEGGRVVLHVGRQPIDFWAFSAAMPNGQSLKQQYAYLFTQAASGKAFVTEKDLSGPNAVQFQLMRVVHDAADRDGDGKLTRAEFDAYFDLQDGFRNISMSLMPAVQTPTLFQVLDENRDGRLSVRELRTAWDRLSVLEEPGAAVVTRNVIQPSVALRLTRAFDRYNAAVVPVAFPDGNQNRVPVPTKGPLWFRKMDRNGDGDVSRAEWVGTRAEFDAIDADRDNLISLEEADAWDKKTRKDEK